MGWNLIAPRFAPDPTDPSIVAICRACGNDGTRFLSWLRKLEYVSRFRTGSYLAYAWGDQGFYAGTWNKEGFRLAAIAVVPEARRQGLGTTMLRHLLFSMQNAGRRRLTFRCAAGSPAEQWWLKRGARPIGRKGSDVEMEIIA